MSASMTIGRLASLGEVNVETIRYYQREGLLPTPTRPPGQIRRYGKDELDRLRFIRRTQHMGFSLREIGQLLSLRLAPACRETRVLVADRLAGIEDRITELTGYRDDLRAWVTECDRNVDHDCCPTLDRLG